MHKPFLPLRRMKHWRIAVCALAMAGIQVCYAAQINLGTAQLLLLGISERAVSLAWLAGPLSGLIVQPIVGHISDGCTHWLGRRRPFLIAGTIFTTAALLLFSHATQVSTFLSGRPSPSFALSLAVCSFFLLDFSIQAIQAPLRALITDVVPQPQRALANSYIGVFTGLGNLLGGVLAAMELSKVFPFFQRDVQALFCISALLLIVTVAACVVTTHEEPLQPAHASGRVSVSRHGASRRVAEGDGISVATPLLSTPRLAHAHESFEPGWRGAIQALQQIPRPFWQVFLVQLCTWCGFFTLFVYVNTWVGRNVYLGDGTAVEGSALRTVFEEGVRLGGKGNALTAVITLAYSLALPYLLRKCGVVPIYAFSQVVEAACLMLAIFIRGTPGQKAPSGLLRMATLLDIGMFGVVWATTMSVPWTLIGDALESDHRYARQLGLFTTLFNASQSFPQLVVAFGAPFVLSIAGDDPAGVMFVGGVFGLLGAILVGVLKLDVSATPAVLDEESILEEDEEEEIERERGYALRISQSFTTDGFWT
ncbi:Sucrose transport protein SUC2 [Gracilariopsis chorda]|uniref:Sucrose transport protein SUC2 n=1 Tax=Gracilariopsis chorda TaxID=448386 RepID=A0A2V3IQH9_9FLOR|nr:Sucrose transport protein SUC2 [Gracilariopsis chorda]|eukprot:PXF44333.1 Sucrose transport protein SUC2 [Gracilariopsis chorda]